MGLLALGIYLYKKRYRVTFTRLEEPVPEPENLELNAEASPAGAVASLASSTQGRSDDYDISIAGVNRASASAPSRELVVGFSGILNKSMIF